MVGLFLRRWDANEKVGTVFPDGERIDAICTNKFHDTRELPSPTLAEAGLEWRDTTYIVSKVDPDSGVARKRLKVHFRPRNYDVVLEEMIDDEWLMTLATDPMDYKELCGLEMAEAIELD